MRLFNIKRRSWLRSERLNGRIVTERHAGPALSCGVFDVPKPRATALHAPLMPDQETIGDSRFGIYLYTYVQR